MLEKILTFYDYKNMCIEGIMIIKVNNKDKITYKNPITLYSSKQLKSVLLAHISILRQKGIELSAFKENILNKACVGFERQNITILDEFVLKSDNKNQSSRNKRMLEYANLSHLERIDIYEKHIA